MLSLASVDANLPPVVAGRLKFDNALNQGEKGIISAYTHIIARMNAGTPLANQYGAGINRLSGIPLDAEPLSLTIAAISRAPASLFMCHFQPPLFYAAEPS